MVRELLSKLPEDDLSNRAKALRTLGVAQVKQGAYQEAESTLRQALNLSQAVHDVQAQADTFTHLSQCAYFLNNFEGALAFAFKGLEASRNADSKLDEAFALHNIGWVYDNFGLHKDALESFSAELTLLEEADVTGKLKARSLNALGVCHNRMGDYERAMTYLESSLSLAKGQEDVRGQALALGNLGSVMDDRAEHEEALRYYEESLTLYLQVDDPYELARRYTAMGEAFLNLERDDEARSAFTQALVHLQRLPNVSLKIDVLLNLSALARRQGDDTLEHNWLVKAGELANEDSAPADAYRVHRALADLLKSRGKHKRALEHFERFHNLQERVRGEAEQRRTKGLLLQFDVERLQFEREMYRIKHVELASAYAKLEDLSVRDPLTNLHNRRHLSQQLPRELERARRYGRTLSVMLCDIDNFKSINDTFSHAIGDEVLKEVANIIHSRTRVSDLKARYGGEELVVVFPETELKNALTTCEAIRRAVEGHDWATWHPNLKVTLSIGVVEFESEASADSLLRAADDYMYQAKNSGKNRVCSPLEDTP